MDPILLSLAWAIATGFVCSNPATDKQWQSYSEERQRAIVKSIAVKRLGTPEDMVFGVLLFVSEYVRWITRQVISIDGRRL